MRILIVDDDQLLRVTLSEIFVMNGFDVLTAGNGKEAIKIFSEDNINFVLMDIQMPEMDGFSAYQQMTKLKSTNKRNHSYIILMTGNSDRLEDAKKEGARVITKPFNVDEVISLFLEMKREDENLRNDEYFIHPFSPNNHVKF